jgi:hypothetical protein
MSHDRTATFGSHPRYAGRPRFPDRWLAARLERLLASVDVRLQLWDGQSSWTSSRRPIGTLIIGDRRTLLGLIVNPELWFGDAYMTGRLQVQGHLERVLEALYRLSPPIPSLGAVPRRLRGVIRHRVFGAVPSGLRTRGSGSAGLDSSSAVRRFTATA